ncbi:MAG: amidohydrolase [Caldilineaceae bacterium]
MQADLVLYNGDIHTMDRRHPRATAVAIAGDRFVALGGDDAMRGLLKEDGRAVDLGGRTVTPGFIDAHIHFLSYGLSLREIDLVNTPTLASAQDRVRARAAETPAGQWLMGRGWDQSVWTDGDFPHRTDLDAITSEHPVFLRRKCGHVGWANSTALALAGITAQTPDPDGGEIERDEQGEPTGILKENAQELMFKLLADPSNDEAADAVRAAMQNVHRMGIVGVHNLEGAAALRAMQHLRQTGELKLRVMAQVPEADLDAAIQLGLQYDLGDEILRIGAVKVFSDGALGARTAWMVDPYEGEPDNYGIAVADAEHMRAVVDKAVRAGFPVFTHAIGDMANRVVLDAIEASRRAGIGLNLRHRIEHAQVLHPDDLDRFAALGVIASMQPIHCTQDMLLADKKLGRAQPLCAYAWRTLWDSGAIPAFGSDAPVETPDVIQGIHAAVTRTRRRHPGGDGLDPRRAYRRPRSGVGVHGGCSLRRRRETIKGIDTPGKLADLVVLSQDIFSINPAAILETDIVATVFGGEFVHDTGLV